MMNRLRLWWVARKRVEHIQTISVPADAYLFMTVTPDMLDVDMACLRKELQEFFGKDRKIVITRAGDVQWSVVTFEEGAGSDRD